MHTIFQSASVNSVHMIENGILLTIAGLCSRSAGVWRERQAVAGVLDRAVARSAAGLPRRICGRAGGAGGKLHRQPHQPHGAPLNSRPSCQHDSPFSHMTRCSSRLNAEFRGRHSTVCLPQWLAHDS